MNYLKAHGPFSKTTFKTRNEHGREHGMAHGLDHGYLQASLSLIELHEAARGIIRSAHGSAEATMA